MQSKNNMKRKGFTLVELLIVIVVIGILSAMMMLSSTEAVSSAKASNIVSNLRNLKTATLAYYVDHLDSVENIITEPTNFKDDVIAYMNNKDNLTDDNYKPVITATGEWYVEYTIQGTATEKASIKTKLAGRAKSVGLCVQNTSKDAYTNGDVVAMYVR